MTPNGAVSMVSRKDLTAIVLVNSASTDEVSVIVADACSGPLAPYGLVMPTVNAPAPAPLPLAICTHGCSAVTVHAGDPVPSHPTVTDCAGDVRMAAPAESTSTLNAREVDDTVSTLTVSVAIALRTNTPPLDAMQRYCAPSREAPALVMVSTGVSAPE